MQMTFTNSRFRPWAATSMVPLHGLGLVDSTGAIGSVHALAGRLML